LIFLHHILIIAGDYKDVKIFFSKLITKEGFCIAIKKEKVKYK